MNGSGVTQWEGGGRDGDDIRRHGAVDSVLEIGWSLDRVGRIDTR